MTYQKGTRQNVLDYAESHPNSGQKDVAAEFGISQKTVSNIYKEDGRARVNDIPGVWRDGQFHTE